MDIVIKHGRKTFVGCRKEENSITCLRCNKENATEFKLDELSRLVHQCKILCKYCGMTDVTKDSFFHYCLELSKYDFELHLKDACIDEILINSRCYFCDNQSEDKNPVIMCFHYSVSFITEQDYICTHISCVNTYLEIKRVEQKEALTIRQIHAY